MADAPEPGSPLWWLLKLDTARRDRNTHLRRYDDYYCGDHPLAYATEQFRMAFGEVYESFADNWMQLVVDAPRERLAVTGFALPDGATSDAAWSIWQDNQMDAESQVLFTEAIKASEAAVSVWRGANGRPKIAVEDPQETIVAFDSGNRRVRRAALKVWTDEWTGDSFANVALPDAVHKFRGPSESTGGLVLPGGIGQWSRWAPREERGPSGQPRPNPLPNPLGVVPFVPLVNRRRIRKDPRTGLWGESELEPVMANQDAVNKLVADMMLTSDAAGYPGKWATGVDPPRDPTTGEVLPSWKVSLLKILTTPNDGARFGDFTAAELRNNVAAIENRIQAIASQTRTPPHYFYLRGEFPSGESLKAAEAGLVAKTHDKIQDFSEPLEEVIVLAFRAAGEPLPEGWERMEAEWSDPEYHTEAARADAKTKLVEKRIISVQQAQRDLGYSPQERERIRRELQEEALVAQGVDLSELSTVA